jgi:hypothetical protein
MNFVEEVQVTFCAMRVCVCVLVANDWFGWQWNVNKNPCWRKRLASSAAYVAK